jgi:competence protein ComEA
MMARNSVLRQRSLVACLLLVASSSLLALEINTANEAELDSIKGLGPSTTGRILQERANAPFASWQDLLRRVKGIKAKTAEKLSQEGLTVDGKPYPSGTVPALTPSATPAVIPPVTPTVTSPVVPAVTSPLPKVSTERTAPK